MLKIRLQRVGRKHEPSFRLVLTDSKNSTKSGRFGEILGNYDPRKSVEAFKSERIKHWVAKGAGLTGTVNNLLVKKGIIRGKKTHVGMDNVMKSAPMAEVLPTTQEGVGTPTESVGAVEKVVETPTEAVPTEPTPAAETPAPVEEISVETASDSESVPEKTPSKEA